MEPGEHVSSFMPKDARHLADLVRQAGWTMAWDGGTDLGYLGSALARADALALGPDSSDLFLALFAEACGSGNGEAMLERLADASADAWSTLGYALGKASSRGSPLAAAAGEALGASLVAGLPRLPDARAEAWSVARRLGFPASLAGLGASGLDAMFDAASWGTLMTVVEAVDSDDAVFGALDRLLARLPLPAGEGLAAGARAHFSDRRGPRATAARQGAADPGTHRTQGFARLPTNESC